MCSARGARALPRAGCPIQKPPDHRALTSHETKQKRKRIQILLYGILEISIDLFGCQCAGGDERIRTADPLLAKQVLSQLSYIPWAADAPRYSDTENRCLPPHADRIGPAGGFQTL